MQKMSCCTSGQHKFFPDSFSCEGISFVLLPRVVTFSDINDSAQLVHQINRYKINSDFRHQIVVDSSKQRKVSLCSNQTSEEFTLMAPLNSFITDLASNWGQIHDNYNNNSNTPISVTQKVRIHSWTLHKYDHQSEANVPLYVVTYQIYGNKYCQNVGRQHKSNGIMFDVDINRGCVFQKCWDQDCRGYRSPPVNVPHAMLPDLYDIDMWARKLTSTSSVDSPKIGCAIQM
jgi:hypothetical protein